MHNRMRLLMLTTILAGAMHSGKALAQDALIAPAVPAA